MAKSKATNSALSAKIKHLRKSGYKQKQAVAIAYSELGLSNSKKKRKK